MLRFLFSLFLLALIFGMPTLVGAMLGFMTTSYWIGSGTTCVTLMLIGVLQRGVRD